MVGRCSLPGPGEVSQVNNPSQRVVFQGKKEGHHAYYKGRVESPGGREEAGRLQLHSVPEDSGVFVKGSEKLGGFSAGERVTNPGVLSPACWAWWASPDPLDGSLCFLCDVAQAS